MQSNLPRNTNEKSVLTTHFIFLPVIAAIFIVFTFIWGQFRWA